MNHLTSLASIARKNTRGLDSLRSPQLKALALLDCKYMDEHKSEALVNKAEEIKTLRVASS